MDRALNDCCRSFAFLFLGIVKFLEKRNRGTISPVYFNIDPRLISLKQKPLLHKEAHWGKLLRNAIFIGYLHPDEVILKPLFLLWSQKTPGDFDFVPWPKNGEIDILDAFQRMVKASAPWSVEHPVVGCGCVLPG